MDESTGNGFHREEARVDKRDAKGGEAGGSLLKLSGVYLLARGIPGIISFLAIAAYTRLLDPDQYGRYALVIAGTGLFNSFFFQWLRLSLLRFLPAYADEPKQVLSTVALGFSLVVVGTGFLGLLGVSLSQQSEWRGFVAVGVVLLWVQAWFDLNLELARSRLAPARYGWLSGVKALTGLILGVVLVIWGLGAYGPLLGLIAGLLLAGLGLSWREWRGLSLDDAILERLKRMLRYGMPLAANFALAFVVAKSDRFFIVWFLDEAAAGEYSAGYDIGWGSLGLLLSVVNLAGVPLVFRAFEEEGIGAARDQLQVNLTLLSAMAVPASVGLALLAPAVAGVVLGERFVDAGAKLLPWIALGNFLFAMKVYYSDLSFHLVERMTGLVAIALASAIVNVGLNIWWIPVFGIMGAAYATVASYGVAVSFSWLVGRRVVRLPRISVEEVKVLVCVGVMSLVLVSVDASSADTALALGLMIMMGAVVYLVCLLVLNPLNMRSRLLDAIAG